ncbi:hypothetical protein DSO57_1026126 [Entomophthora muscae]|uniref:Uncharacterized protein n=2 Tax=Entomophthora muscae TaxID=34485 RepID=A0ACC2U018_9FUNG|nr:hypothetical protein DSO57_1037514 [Entomophthora muscae]KAJ9080333.1 hypothetical protein DSO57_1026126 [Entomophthora muscae]
MAGVFMYYVSAFAAIGGLLFGYDVGVISGVLGDPNFKKVFAPLDSLRMGLITSFLVLGCFIGALISGWSTDKLGRRSSIMASSLVFTLGALLQTFSGGLGVMIVGRIIAGLAVGILSMAVPLYQCEVSEPSVRGRLMSLQQWAITIGIAVSFWINYLCSSFLKGEVAWRLPLGLQIVPAVILFFGCFVMPYSPRWLLSKGRESEAMEGLASLRAGGDTTHPAVLEEFNEIKDTLQQEHSLSHSYASLFEGTVLRRVFLGVFIQAFQQLTGINSVMYYAPQIFKQAGFGIQAGLLATAINGIVNMTSTIPAILYVDRWGRRMTLMAGAVVMAIGMAVVGIVIAVYGVQSKDAITGETIFSMRSISASYTVIVFIYIFVAGFAFSWGPIAWIYPAEIFPMRVRSKGASLTTASNWAFNYIVSLLTPILMDKITWGLYIVFAGFCVVMTLAVYFFYPETRGYSLEDMDLVFAEGVSARNPQIEKAKA